VCSFFRKEFYGRRSNELLEGPLTGEPSALPKSRFPEELVRLVVSFEGRGRDIPKIDVAFSRITVLAKLGAAGISVLTTDASAVRSVEARMLAALGKVDLKT
jgi:hypothetical protein